MYVRTGENAGINHHFLTAVQIHLSFPFGQLQVVLLLI